MALKKIIPKAQPMNFATYMVESRYTADKSLPQSKVWPTTLAGLGGECGEILDLLKKEYGHGHTLDMSKLVKELGDFSWYCAEAAMFLDIKLIDNRLLGVPVKTFDTPLPATYYLMRLVGQFYLNFGCTEDMTSDAIYEEGATQQLLMIIKAWFNLCDLFGLSRPVIYQTNLDKLRARYPNGFSSEASINRVV